MARTLTQMATILVVHTYIKLRIAPIIINWHAYLPMIFQAFKEANRWVLRVWYDRWWLWLLMFGGVEVFTQLFYALLDGLEASQVGYLLGSMMGSSLDFILAVLVPPVLVGLRQNQKVNLGQHFHRYFNQACIESLRSTARVCWFSYLLLIPGFVKLIRLQFVAYVVQFDAAYDAGKRDALKTSEALTKGYFFTILGYLILASTLTLLEGLRQSFEWNSPYFALAFVLTLPIRIYTQIGWFSLYEELVKRSTK